MAALSKALPPARVSSTGLHTTTNAIVQAPGGGPKKREPVIIKAQRKHLALVILVVFIFLQHFGAHAHSHHRQFPGSR